MQTRVRGYEIRCSAELAKLLGASFGLFRGLGALHWDDGWLWWIEKTDKEDTEDGSRRKT